MAWRREQQQGSENLIFMFFPSSSSSLSCLCMCVFVDALATVLISRLMFSDLSCEHKRRERIKREERTLNVFGNRTERTASRGMKERKAGRKVAADHLTHRISLISVAVTTQTSSFFLHFLILASSCASCKG